MINDSRVFLVPTFCNSTWRKVTLIKYMRIMANYNEAVFHEILLAPGHPLSLLLCWHFGRNVLSVLNCLLGCCKISVAAVDIFNQLADRQLTRIDLGDCGFRSVNGRHVQESLPIRLGTGHSTLVWPSKVVKIKSMVTAGGPLLL